jgi:hypothetical protein
MESGETSYPALKASTTIINQKLKASPMITSQPRSGGRIRSAIAAAKKRMAGRRVKGAAKLNALTRKNTRDRSKSRMNHMNDSGTDEARGWIHPLTLQAGRVTHYWSSDPLIVDAGFQIRIVPENTSVTADGIRLVGPADKATRQTGGDIIAVVISPGSAADTTEDVIIYGVPRARRSVVPTGRAVEIVVSLIPAEVPRAIIVTAVPEQAPTIVERS